VGEGANEREGESEKDLSRNSKGKLSCKLRRKESSGGLGVKGGGVEVAKR